MTEHKCIPGPDHPAPSTLPAPQGLYHPRHEHDACGIGFVASIKGHKSHDIIAKGIQVLINLTHRGACGCDPDTGDGAGILIQIPHKFFARECANLGFTLPAEGEYGVGMTFLPVEPHQRLSCEGILERTAGPKKRHDRAFRRQVLRPQKPEQPPKTILSYNPTNSANNPDGPEGRRDLAIG